MKKSAFFPDIKLKILKANDNEHVSLLQAYVKFKIQSRSVIVIWQRDFANFGVEGLQLKPKGSPKLMSYFKCKSDIPLTRKEELLLENERLRCELWVNGTTQFIHVVMMLKKHLRKYQTNLTLHLF